MALRGASEGEERGEGTRWQHVIAYLPLLERRLRAVQLGGVQVVQVEAERRLQPQPERILNSFILVCKCMYCTYS